MGFEWLGSLTSLVELITSFIPRRSHVQPTDRGIKYVRMKRIKVLEPGNYWYVPFFSVIHVHNVMPRPMELSRQYVTTQDGRPFWVDGSLQISIVCSEEAIIRAFVEHDDIEGIVASEATNAIAERINDSLVEELYDRNAFNIELTKLIRKRLRRYGVRTHRAYIATLVTGWPLLLLGTNSVE